MSECVVRMEMPKSCEGCWMPSSRCKWRTLAWYLKDDSTVSYRNSRSPFCPIICSLPEGHGRLVDADEMLKKIENYHRYMTIGRESDPRCIIEDSPTIVPADGRKERNMRYRKKPVVIEAFQTDKELDIETLEGTMHASVGDYIITGVRGEKYPCKPDIFEQTYEPADTPASPWRRVEEELPPKATWVLTVATDGNVKLFNIATVDAGGQWWTYSPQNILRELYGVRYWMPIEPPKEDADGNK